MEMDFASFNRALNRENAASAPDSDQRAAWAGLRARFLAAEALRRAGGAVQDAGRGGSFDAAAADRLNAYANAQHGINPTALADGKAPGGNPLGDAGAHMPGDRG